MLAPQLNYPMVYFSWKSVFSFRVGQIDATEFALSLGAKFLVEGFRTLMARAFTSSSSSSYCF